jgi:hypothetical protein
MKTRFKVQYNGLLDHNLLVYSTFCNDKCVYKTKLAKANKMVQKDDHQRNSLGNPPTNYRNRVEEGRM